MAVASPAHAEYTMIPDEPRTITASGLASRVGGVLEGDGDCVIRGVATIEDAGADDVTWVASPEILPRVANSRAGVVLIPTDCAAPEGRIVIKVHDPDSAVCKVLAFLAPPRDVVPPGVHASAIIEPGAVVDGAAVGAHVYVGPGVRIGEGTQLYPGVFVGMNTVIGRDCALWPNVVVREGTTIGDRVVIHPNATIGADGFSYLQRDGAHRKIPQIGTVAIEDDVEIGANTTIDRARSGVTRIGRGTKIDNLVQVAHNVKIGEHCILVGQSGVAGSSVLGRHVFLSGQVGVSDHRKIGDGVQVASSSAVLADVPNGQTVRGNPAIGATQFARREVALRKLPDLIKQVRELSRRVEELERGEGG